jgi:DNA helicase-2/ATP-dependent DNA helicase PcrA
VKINNNFIKNEVEKRLASILDNLNDVQLEAVETIDGPLLILAGAGTGKTRVLTTRIVNIIQKGKADYSEILAVTFTNKAANEMKERIRELMDTSTDGWYIGTFHSIAVRMLRRHAENIDYKNNFTILDMDDSSKLLKEILVNMNVDTKNVSVGYILSVISRWKDRALMPNMVPVAEDKPIGNTTIIDTYIRYQNRIKELNCMDFGDLLLLLIELFKKNPDILNYWQQNFKYILVDEYQDTNIAQYILLRILSMGYKNICCVGDDDQSIYSWRGAEVGNILRFEEDFEGAKVLRLEQNYRSTKDILGAATSLIANNSERFDKTLWTDKNEGEKVKVYSLFDGKSEANFIAKTIVEKYKAGFDYKNIAILVRASSLTREFEEKLNINQIPYKIVGGNKFYDRLEVKDAVAYLRLVYLQDDDFSFERIVNVPKRGIGASTLEKIKDYARINKISMFLATEQLLLEGVFPNKISMELENFIDVIKKYSTEYINEEVSLFAERVLEEVKYLEMWRNDKTEDAKQRIDNLKEFVSSTKNFSLLQEFLEHVSLVSDNNELNNDNKVSLMTIHAAKGLEFDVVFLPGFEEGIFPNQRVLDESGEKGLEEERRLAYVAITRAKKESIISFCNNRLIYRDFKNMLKSRFLDEINEDYLEIINNNLEEGYRKVNFGNHNSSLGSIDGMIQHANYPNNDLKKAKMFNVGDRVTHKTYGFGIVKAIVGVSLAIEFEDFGKMEIMASYLEKIQ